MPLVPDPKNCDISVKRAIQGLSKKLGYTGSPTHASITLTDLTASSLVGTNASKLLESVTIGLGLNYTRPTLKLSHLGIQDLTDPGADRILFWDDSASASKWLVPNTLISITGTNLNVDSDLHNYSWTSVDATDLKVGSVTQAWDAGLDSLAALTYVSDSFIKVTAENTYAIRTIAETKTDLSLNLVENTALSTWTGTTNITTVGSISGNGTAVFAGASVTIGTASTTTGTLVLHDSNSANTITLTVPDISAGSLSFTLPPTNGDNTNVLQTDGNGVLTWVAAGGAHTHDGDTLQLDGINSDGGAFSFTTSGDVTFDENVIVSKHMALGGAAIDADIGLGYTEVLTDTDNSTKVGIYSYTQVKKTAAAMTAVAYALVGTLSLDSTNTQNWTETQAGLRGFQGTVTTEAGSSGTVTGAACGFLTATVANAATVTNLYGLYINTPTVAGSKVTNEYGLYVKDQNTGATLNYSIYTGAGLVRFGDSVSVGSITAPAQSSKLHLYNGDSGATAGTGYDVNAVFFLENNDHCTALIYTPNDKQGIWGFADSGDTFVAGLTYDHNTDKMWLYSNNGVRFTILSDGGIVIPGIKAGITQAAAGAAANELWRDTDDGNTIKLGV